MSTVGCGIGGTRAEATVELGCGAGDCAGRGAAMDAFAMVGNGNGGGPLRCPDAGTKGNGGCIAGAGATETGGPAEGAGCCTPGEGCCGAIKSAGVRGPADRSSD